MSTTTPADNAPIIWVLADDRAGNRAQCLGVADRLGYPYIVKELRYSWLVALPNNLRGASLRGVSGESAKALSGPWPDVVIAAGRRSAPVARWIKRQSPQTRLVQLMWPDAGAAEFDCIVLPSHDKAHKDSPQVLRVLGAPHRITPKVLEEATAKWSERLGHLPDGPRIAVLVGGDNKHGSFTDADYHRVGALAKTFATSVHGSILLTTSRRTGKAGEKVLQGHLDTLPHHNHLWSNAKDEENPYLGYLALADAVVVTADSIAMCSEACATHKPVFLYKPLSLSPKHERFVNTLIATGYAYPLDEEFVSAMRKPMKHTPLDSAATIAEHIRNSWLASASAAV